MNTNYQVGTKYVIKFTESSDINFYRGYGVDNGDIMKIIRIDAQGDTWFMSKTGDKVCIAKHWLQPVVTPALEFSQGFFQFIQDNPDIEQEFNDAWHNADTVTIRLIVSDYLAELNAIDV